MLRLAAVLIGAALFAGQAPVSSARSIVVIGDLHMGPGRDESGNWHPYEDFRWRDEFIRFIDALMAGDDPIDLVINGDLFELLQSPSVPCVYSDPKLGCALSGALQRLFIAARSHAMELAALGKFAAAGDNRIHIVPGDHDAALLVREAWQRVETAIGAPAGRVSLAASGRWLSPDGRVHVEHGHQLPLSADRFPGWPAVTVMDGRRTHLERPWGEQVILPFYDRTETKYPIVDNIAEEGVGAKFVAAVTVDDPAGMLRFLLTKTTWQQFRMDLDDGEVQAPMWDLARIRKDVGAFMAASLPADDPFAAAVKNTAPASLSAAGSQLTDREIVAICDYRAAIRRARRRMERVLTQLSGVGAPMPECPRMPDTVGSAFEYYWRSRDQQIAQYIPRAKELDVIVLGHTHLLDRPYRPLGEDGPAVVTSGAWQRTIHPNDLKTIDAPLESLPACYSFVRISGAGKRVAQLQSWRLDDRQQWSFANGC